MTALATVPQTSIMEDVVAKGDLSKLTGDERARYYMEVCQSVGLNPLTQPFEYLVLKGKTVLYAKKGCAEQLRNINGINIYETRTQYEDDLVVVTVFGEDRNGRKDSEIGAVPIAGLRGEDKANALMKALTKAKRRLTLSMCGLGMLDESEVETIPSARTFNGPVSIHPVEPTPDDGKGKNIGNDMWNERATAEVIDTATGEIIPDSDDDNRPGSIHQTQKDQIKAELARLKLTMTDANRMANERYKANVVRLTRAQGNGLLDTLRRMETPVDPDAERKAQLQSLHGDLDEKLAVLDTPSTGPMLHESLKILAKTFFPQYPASLSAWTLEQLVELGGYITDTPSETIQSDLDDAVADAAKAASGTEG